MTLAEKKNIGGPKGSDSPEIKLKEHWNCLSKTNNYHTKTFPGGPNAYKKKNGP